MSYPNREKDAVLDCGCVTTYAFAIRILGSGAGVEWQSCHNHSSGLHRILREASPYERINFYANGIPATKRRTAKSPSQLLDLLGEHEKKADAQPESKWASEPLF
jgi:hypothetical protein